MQLNPAVRLDARRAVFLEDHGTLLVSDVHLGYAWIHRRRGQLLPLTAPDNVLEKLLELQRDFKPERVVFLGDLVHAAAPVPALLQELRGLRALARGSRLTLVCGNHDTALPALLRELELPIDSHEELLVGPHLLLHGHNETAAKPGKAGRIFVGHEHPAIRVDDGVTTSVKCPCFLISSRLVVLPAFSPWAPGYSVRDRIFLGPLARRARFGQAAAILGGRLLPLSLK